MKIIDSALRKTFFNKTKSLETHFVFASHFYYDYQDQLESFILRGMKKYKIKSVMVTHIDMWRTNLITKEVMENFCNGGDLWHKRHDSVNDDLESLFEDLRLGNELKEKSFTYFLPKLTEEEMELVEKKDPSYLETLGSFNPDVDESEMKLSESDSKFVRGLGWRRTFTIKNPSSQKI